LLMLAAVLLVVASAMVFYVIAVYPILLAVFARRTAPPVQKDMGFRTTVSVLVAVHNGEEFIRGKLECLLGLDYPAHLMEILVVSDGSTDATEAIVESFADRGVRLIRTSHAGKAAAVNAALCHASGEVLFLTDVRQALDAYALSHLVANFADPSIGAVTGELRFLGPDRTGEEADMELYWRYELLARRRHSRIDSIFNTTGCIYAIRRSLAAPIPPDTLADDAVIPLKAFFRGYRVICDPEAIAFDHPTSEGEEFQRKLRTLAGLWQVYVRLPELFTTANRMRLHFLSHKFARLALPWAILLMCAATMALPASQFRSLLLTDELALVALAVLDHFVPKGFFLKRVSSPARSFLTMNLASLLAIGVFVVPPETLWRPTRVKVRH